MMKLSDEKKVRHSGAGRNPTEGSAEPVVRYWIPGQARNNGMVASTRNGM
jgi:hypothetical protein